MIWVSAPPNPQAGRGLSGVVRETSPKGETRFGCRDKHCRVNSVVSVHYAHANRALRVHAISFVNKLITAQQD